MVLLRMSINLYSIKYIIFNRLFLLTYLCTGKDDWFGEYQEIEDTLQGHTRGHVHGHTARGWDRTMELDNLGGYKSLRVVMTLYIYIEPVIYLSS